MMLNVRHCVQQKSLNKTRVYGLRLLSSAMFYWRNMCETIGFYSAFNAISLYVRRVQTWHVHVVCLWMGARLPLISDYFHFHVFD